MRTLKPVSLAVSLKVFLVAPVIATHDESTYFCHWKVNLGTGDPVHCAAVEVAVIVAPTPKEPVLEVIVGAGEFAGMLPTAVVLLAQITNVPPVFVPVAAKVINFPLSSLCNV